MKKSNCLKDGIKVNIESLATPILEGHTEEENPTREPKVDEISFVT